MEAEQQPQENGAEATKGGNYLCRQSSTRWTPTPEQIRILKDLYYNRGVRSPNGEQIQSISATLRQYGKIEGKNVFYWFQNHKARERQKKRFTADHHHQLAVQAAARPTPPIPNPSAWTKPSNPTPNSYIYSNFTSSGFFPASSSSAATGIAVGQMGSYGYGMEKSFRECSISAGGGGSRAQNNYGWVASNGIDPYYSNFFEHQKPEEQDEEDKAEEIETLPLFPTQREDIMSMSGFCNSAKYNSPNSCYSYSFYGSDDHAFVSASSAASLELSLNSYASQGSDC